MSEWENEKKEAKNSMANAIVISSPLKLIRLDAFQRGDFMVNLASYQTVINYEWSDVMKLNDFHFNFHNFSYKISFHVVIEKNFLKI
jgi:hypothetical protein